MIKDKNKDEGVEKKIKKKVFVILIFILMIFSYLCLSFYFSKVNSKSQIETTQEKKDKNVTGEHEYIVPSKYDKIKLKTIEEADAEKRYLLHASWPVTENEKINKILEEKAQAFISEFKEVSIKIQTAREKYIAETGSDGATFHASYNLHFDVAFADENYLAFVFSLYRNTGNTGTDDVLSLIFNRQTGEVILAADLFVDSDYLIELSKLARQELYARIDKEVAGMKFDSEIEKEQWLKNFKEGMVDVGTLPKAENFKNIVINEAGSLEIYFDKYQVAPGYWGQVKIEIPLVDIQELFMPEVRKFFNLEAKVIKESESDRSDDGKEKVSENKEVSFSREEKDLVGVDCTKEKCIALTFDDGPSIYTETLLSTLKEKGVKATFFVLGVNAKVQQQTLIDLNKAGMEIGNHTWSHKDLTKLSEEAVEEEVNNSADLVLRIIGKRPFLVRPPYGAVNGQVKTLVEAPLILWGIDPEDWKYRDSTYIAKHIIEKAKGGAIVLAHDIHEATVEAMPEVIDTLLSEGYKLVTISELFGSRKLQNGQTYHAFF